MLVNDPCSLRLAIEESRGFWLRSEFADASLSKQSFFETFSAIFSSGCAFKKDSDVVLSGVGWGTDGMLEWSLRREDADTSIILSSD